ncbi:MAG TPA: hypothetical protein VFD59_03140 [Nocardioidaceae bacterium]|nr:hypothetical protein [Nocardioidaceae bacterium]
MTPHGGSCPSASRVTTVVLASGSAYSVQAIQRKTVGTKRAQNNSLATIPILGTIDHRHIP